MDTYLGLDFGGTKLLIGEVTADGTILQSKSYPTCFTKQQEAAKAILEDLEDYLQNVGIRGDLKAAGLGIVGIVDHTKGEWIAMQHEIAGPPIPLAALLEQRLQVPCAIDNDVRSATTAEWLLGKGRQSQDFLYLNIGTGLAVGIVTGGHLMRGAHHDAGEIGHMVVDMSDKQPCICGREGCIENVASGIGFTQQVKRYGLTELLNGQERAEVKELFQRAKAGDVRCLQIVDYAADALACLIMNLVRVCDPDTIIVGGGVISDGWLLERVKLRLEPSTMRGVKEGIVFSSFDSRCAGLMGAASLGMLKLSGGGK